MLHPYILIYCVAVLSFISLSNTDIALNIFHFIFGLISQKKKKKLFSLKASKLYSISYPKSSPGEIVREFGMDVYTLLYLKWRTNHDLLYSAGTLLNVMWQPGSGWGGLGENGCVHMYG